MILAPMTVVVVGRVVKEIIVLVEMGRVVKTVTTGMLVAGEEGTVAWRSSRRLRFALVLGRHVRVVMVVLVLRTDDVKEMNEVTDFLALTVTVGPDS